MVCTDRLLAIADGMGGHPGGEIAAAMAVTLVEAGFTGRSLDEIEAAVRAANRAIWQRASVSPGLEGMGTTISTVGLRDDGSVAVTNVGDSRAYMIRDGRISQLTRDHSLVNDYLKVMPDMPEDQRNELPKNVITRALGMQDSVDLVP